VRFWSFQSSYREISIPTPRRPTVETEERRFSYGPEGRPHDARAHRTAPQRIVPHHNARTHARRHGSARSTDTHEYNTTHHTTPHHTQPECPTAVCPPQSVYSFANDANVWSCRPCRRTKDAHQRVVSIEKLSIAASVLRRVKMVECTRERFWIGGRSSFRNRLDPPIPIVVVISAWLSRHKRTRARFLPVHG